MASSPTAAATPSPAIPLVPLGGRVPVARLPAPLSSLIGREAEIAAVAALLRDPTVRLVTLTGPGGVGKTRLALALAASLGADFPDGVAFVALGSITDPGLVVPTIGQAIGLGAVGRRPVADLLHAALARSRVLLVLDNFEQLLAAAPEIVALLGTCPRVSALVTSRERLRLSGERVVPVPPLAVPAPDSATTAAELAATESIALFAQRARQANPVFSFDEADAAVIAAICRQLDGLPLAIELAAARVDVLPPRALLARLHRRLPLLADGPRDSPPRHRSLRDAIAWSYDLLDDGEQVLFRRLAVFVGGFTIEGAQAVAVGGAGGEGVAERTIAPAPAALDLVASLVQKSLVLHEPDPDGEPRFRMLETIREFAEELLVAGGEEAVVRHAYATYFLALAQRYEPTPFLSDDKQVFDRLEAEHGNLRAVLHWLESVGRGDDATRLAGALAWFWFVRGHLRDTRVWLERAVERGDGASPAIRVRIAIVLSMIALARNELPRAEHLTSDALEIARAAGDRWSTAQALVVLGILASALGDYDRAVAALEDALTTAGMLDEPRQAKTLANSALANLGVAVRGQGRIAAATRIHENALAGHRAVGSARGEMNALADLGDVALQLGDPPRAVERYHAALRLAWEYGDRRTIAWAIEGTGCAAAASGQAGAAARLLGAAARLQDQIGLVSWLPLDQVALESGKAAARAVLGEDAYTAGWTAGQAMPLDEAVAAALAVTIETAERPAVSLTPRELQILPLLAAGRTDREIGATLFLSHRTVEHHVARLCAKLGVRTRPAAIETARAAGLLPAGRAEPTDPETAAIG